MQVELGTTNDQTVAGRNSLGVAASPQDEKLDWSFGTVIIVRLLPMIVEPAYLIGCVLYFLQFQRPIGELALLCF
jgi:hypothetical protein